MSRPAGAPADGGQVRSAVGCTGLLVAVTAAAAVAGAADHGLVSRTAPHPTLQPTLGAILGIALTNGRVLTLPFLLVMFGFAEVRWGRIAGSALLAAVLGGNGLTVGFAIGRWQGRLLPYLPHLPLEWAAAGIAGGAWLGALTHGRPRTYALVLQAVLVAGLIVAGASVEVLLTPHAPAPGVA